MKMNPDGLYEVTEGEIYIKDIVSQEKMIFLLDRKNKLVIRSMLEEDVKKVISLMEISSSEKRKKMRMLISALPEKDSQNHFFVAEKIVGEETKKKWNHIYELERIPIGLGARWEQQLELDVYERYTSESQNVLELMRSLGKHFGIIGKGWIMPKN